jgi:hypothetical protein
MRSSDQKQKQIVGVSSTPALAVCKFQRSSVYGVSTEICGPVSAAKVPGHLHGGYVALESWDHSLLVYFVGGRRANLDT